MLVVGLLQDQPATDLDNRFAGLSAALERQQFKGKPSEQLLINRLEADGPKRLVVLGLGPASSFNLQGVRSAAARAAKAAIGFSGTLGLQLNWDGLEPAAAARAAAEAVRLALYSDQRFRKTADPRRIPEALELIGLAQAGAAGLAAVAPTCAGVELARELVAAPPNVVVTTGVKGETLAHQCQPAADRTVGAIHQVNQLRIEVRALADGEKGAHAAGFAVRPLKHGELQAVAAGDGGGRLG